MFRKGQLGQGQNLTALRCWLGRCILLASVVGFGTGLGLVYTAFAAESASSIYISEFLAENTRGLKDDDGNYSPWIELHQTGTVPVDLVRRHVLRGGQEVKLSPKEFDLLRHLVMHAGKVLTHRHLLREVWGPAQAEEVQYLRVFIRGLRQKLEPDPTRPTHILTELGVGYRLQLPPEQRA